MFTKGQTVRCCNDQDAPDLAHGQCYHVTGESNRQVSVEGIAGAFLDARFEAVWPIRTADVIETAPVTLPGGEGRLTLLRSTSRACGRRVVVHQGGRLLYDSHEQYDEGNALHALDAWLARVTEARAIPF